MKADSFLVLIENLFPFFIKKKKKNPVYIVQSYAQTYLYDDFVTLIYINQYTIQRFVKSYIVETLLYGGHI